MLLQLFSIHKLELVATVKPVDRLGRVMANNATHE